MLQPTFEFDENFWETMEKPYNKIHGMMLVYDGTDRERLAFWGYLLYGVNELSSINSYHN